MRDTLLLVGNGLAMDFCAHAPGMPHPSRPLDYNLTTPGTGLPLNATFSELQHEIVRLRASSPGIKDFSLIEAVRSLPKVIMDDRLFGTPAWRQRQREMHARELVESQLRLHLTHAYTHFTERVDNTEVGTWKWFSWLRDNSERLHTIVSFNYDLLMESALGGIVSLRYLVKSGGIFGLNPEVVVFKPHGSVNFEFAENLVGGLNRSTLYASKNVFSLWNVPIRILDRSELDQQRLSADIVLPSEASAIRRFQYIDPGYRYLRHTRGDIKRCIIIGLSYWKCDQPEIDEILGNLPSNVDFEICNPQAPPEMVRYLSARTGRAPLMTDGTPRS